MDYIPYIMALYKSSIRRSLYSRDNGVEVAAQEQNKLHLFPKRSLSAIIHTREYRDDKSS